MSERGRVKGCVCVVLHTVQDATSPNVHDQDLVRLCPSMALLDIVVYHYSVSEFPLQKGLLELSDDELLIGSVLLHYKLTLMPSLPPDSGITGQITF